MSRTGCEQCGAAQPSVMNRLRAGKFVPAPRERSRCCGMLLCGRCIKGNGKCFSCEPISAAQNVAAALRHLEEADALLAALPNIGAVRAPVSEAVTVLRTNLPHFQTQEAA